ncbi:MAG: ribosome maturation factor RimM [Thermoanaerobaculia bacterium]
MAGDRIALGIIRKAHGVRGEASVEAWSDSPERFAELHTVTLVSSDETQTRDAEIESVRLHAGRALVKFSGIESPEDVQRFQNWTVEIPETEARKLDEDEYFLHDLIGLTLVDSNGQERGTIAGTEEGAGGVLLNVERDGHRFDVPFAAEIVTGIDLAARRATVALPKGLDDLDAVEE